MRGKPGPKPDLPARARRAQQVLEIMRAAAAASAPCPSNNALADRVGCQAHDASTALSILEAHGLVVVRRAHRSRRVTIVATGQSTLWSLSATQARSAAARAARVTDDDGVRLSEAAIAARRVDREPCPRCGVRADVHVGGGCGRALPAFGLSVSPIFSRPVSLRTSGGAA